MTSKEREQVALLLSAANSAASQLEWYAKDFDSCEIKNIAKELKEAVREFKFNKSTAKKK